MQRLRLLRGARLARPRWRPALCTRLRPMSMLSMLTQETRPELLPVGDIAGTPEGWLDLEEVVTLQVDQAFWGRFQSIPEMAEATEKQEILQILENFVLIERRHVKLCQRLKATVIRTVDSWTAPELALLCRHFAELSHLHEDLLLSMVQRLEETVSLCNAQELCLLLDAYATARCNVASVVQVLSQQSLRKLHEFEPRQLCLHASSYARLGLQMQEEEVLNAIASRLEEVPIEEDLVDGMEPSLTARDISMLAHAYCRHGASSKIFPLISRAAQPVLRNFMAKELQTLLVSMARAGYADHELLNAISAQAQRQVAQFSTESLVLTLRGMAFFGRSADPLFTRVICELPRLRLRPAELCCLCSSYAAVQVRSQFLLDLVTPMILEQAPSFQAKEWLMLLRSYAVLGEDEMILAAAARYLQVENEHLEEICLKDMESIARESRTPEASHPKGALTL